MALVLTITRDAVTDDARLAGQMFFMPEKATALARGGRIPLESIQHAEVVGQLQQTLPHKFRLMDDDYKVRFEGFSNEKTNAVVQADPGKPDCVEFWDEKEQVWYSLPV